MSKLDGKCRASPTFPISFQRRLQYMLTTNHAIRSPYDVCEEKQADQILLRCNSPVYETEDALLVRLRLFARTNKKLMVKRNPHTKNTLEIGT